MSSSILLISCKTIFCLSLNLSPIQSLSFYTGCMCFVHFCSHGEAKSFGTFETIFKNDHVRLDMIPGTEHASEALLLQHIHVHWCNKQCFCMFMRAVCIFVCVCLSKRECVGGAAWRRAVVMEPESPAAQLFSQCIVNFTAEPTTHAQP